MNEIKLREEIFEDIVRVLRADMNSQAEQVPCLNSTVTDGASLEIFLDNYAPHIWIDSAIDFGRVCGMTEYRDSLNPDNTKREELTQRIAELNEKIVNDMADYIKQYTSCGK